MWKKRKRAPRLDAMNDTLQNALAGMLIVLGPALGGILFVIGRALAKRWGVEAKETELRIHDSIASNAVAESEQYRRNAQRDSGENPEPEALLARAKAHVLAESAARGVKPPPNPEALIEAKIAEARRSVPPPALVDIPEYDELADGAEGEEGTP